MSDTEGLMFAALREANLARMPMFKNAKGETRHSGADWTRNDWAMALIGELGETANELKKVRRGDFTMCESRDKIARELADTVIYFDLYAAVQNVTFPPLGSFTTLRTQNRLSNVRATAGDHIVHIFDTLAIAINSQQFGYRNPALVASMMYSVLYSIDGLAEYCGVDLGEAVKRTFNMKSAQLELPLYLTNSGPIETGS